MDRTPRKFLEIWNPRRLVAGFLFFIALPAFAAEVSYGKLTVYSDVFGSDIYVDAKFVGQDRAMISSLPVGKHYVRVVKDEKTIQSGLVDVREGEETIIVAKPAEEELLSKFKKQNLIHAYLSYSTLNHTGSKSGSPEITGDLSPLFGVNFEAVFPVPFLDLNTILGFRYNLPASIKSGGVKLTDMTISGPYGNISKRIIERFAGRRNVNLDIGAGLNYSYYSGEMISINGGLGYQLYAELSLKGEAQLAVIRAGYLVNTGRGSNQYNFSNSGYFVSGGVAYQL